MVTLLDSTGINKCTGSVTGLVLKKLYPDFSQQKPGPQVTNQLKEESPGTPEPSVDRRVAQEASKRDPSEGEHKEEEKDQLHAYRDYTALLQVDPKLLL